ncbi:MAG TPA: HlyD family efflux transporter periplasmic adaptor subunit [Chthoniobacterales bacterium]|nr:HlyD family efflux transporter periplasmic adaptor subunit [Chthoniobacterales bacterium]
MRQWFAYNKTTSSIVATVFVVVIGTWWVHARNDPKFAFRVAAVKRGDLVATISATGTIEPVEVVDVGAQVAGQIISFGKDKEAKTIDYGSTVEEGTILAQIDDSVYAADVALAKAQLEQDKAGEVSAAANLEQTKAKSVQADADWQRAQKLGPQGAIAPQASDSFKAAYDIAKANVNVAEAALTQSKATTVKSEATLNKAQRNLDFCTIKSPVKGVIIDRRVNIGQTVVSSLNAPSLFLIAKDLTRMQIWVAVNEADVGRIVPGAPVTFTCDTFPGREFKGTVGKIRLNATMTQNVVMYTVEVNTENPDKLLLPYLTANVRFVAREETKALLVPNAALRWTPSALTQLAPEARSWKFPEPVPINTAGFSNLPKQDKTLDSRVGVLWLRDGKFVRPLEVKIGASDGENTAVASNTLREGQEVVTGENETAQAGTQNPFVPQIRRR